MLNQNKERELAYVVIIDAIEPILGSDNCEAAIIGGWKVMTRKGTFVPGDLAVYFEIDSKVPETDTYAFLAGKHYKIKTQKYKFGGKNKAGFYSQGLLMSAEDFEWGINIVSANRKGLLDNNGVTHFPDDESRFLTKQLGVVYSVAEDNKRKSNNPDAKINAALNRHPRFAKKYGKFIKKYKFTRWLFLLLFGRKRDSRSEWPSWVVKTDEERCQNLPQLFPGDGMEWIATEKIDGTSTTFTMRGFGRKRDYRVCSRNVVMDKPDRNCYYSANVYLEMSEKYQMQDVLARLLDEPVMLNDEQINKDVEFVTVQGETFGAGIQKRDYGMKDHDLRAFNLIYGYKDGTARRFNPIEMTEILSRYNVPCVPIVDEHFLIPETCDDLLAIAEGYSYVDGGLREGLVFRAKDGVASFKAVSNPFLLKYHG